MAHFTCSMCGATVADVTLHACGSFAGLARVVIYPPEPWPQTTEAGWTWTPARRWTAHELARVLLAGPDARVLLDSIELLVRFTDEPWPEGHELLPRMPKP